MILNADQFFAVFRLVRDHFHQGYDRVSLPDIRPITASQLAFYQQGEGLSELHAHRLAPYGDFTILPTKGLYEMLCLVRYAKHPAEHFFVVASDGTRWLDLDVFFDYYHNKKLLREHLQLIDWERFRLTDAPLRSDRINVAVVSDVMEHMCSSLIGQITAGWLWDVYGSRHMLDRPAVLDKPLGQLLPLPATTAFRKAFLMKKPFADTLIKPYFTKKEPILLPAARSLDPLLT